MATGTSQSDIYTYVKASCYCDLNCFRVAFLTTSLPILNELCHCNNCRHSSGQIALYHVKIIGSPLSVTKDEPATLDKLHQYKTSDNVTRYFCAICGAHMFWENRQIPGQPQYCVEAGVLHKVEGIAEAAYHLFLEQTRDGGLADQLREKDGIELPRYCKEKGSAILPYPWTNLSSEQLHKEPSPDERLPCYCHCRAINLYITRPSEVSTIPYAPYPDVLKPFDVTHLSRIRNPQDEKWWLRPISAEKPTKYLAGHCACSSCRFTSGFPIQSWAFVPRANVIDPATGNAIEMLTANKPAGLKQYISSPGKYREFCSTCGATVFWWSTSRDELLDISLGLIDQDVDGVRAERWLEWHRDRVGFSEMALARPTVRALIEGLKTWTPQEY